MLLNPPLRDGIGVTERNVEWAANVLGYCEFRMVNLIDVPTKDLPALNARGRELAPWLASRPVLEEALGSAEALVAGWGVGGLTGKTRANQRDQIGWLCRSAIELGHRSAWVVGNGPRHPSRWRQYVGPQKGRVSGGTWSERLSNALALASLFELGSLGTGEERRHLTSDIRGSADSQ